MLTIIHLTLFEARRRRIVLAAVVGGLAFLAISPSDALWRMAAYYLMPAVVRDLQYGPPMITSATPPTGAMVVWAVLLTIGVLLWAMRSFNKRAL